MFMLAYLIKADEIATTNYQKKKNKLSELNQTGAIMINKK